jgi:hypothetical protein
MKKQFLDVEGISEYLTMSKSCIYKKVAAKEIPHILRKEFTVEYGVSVIYRIIKGVMWKTK